MFFIGREPMVLRSFSRLKSEVTGISPLFLRSKTFSVAEGDTDGSRTLNLVNFRIARFSTSSFLGERLCIDLPIGFTSGLRAMICCTRVIFPSTLKVNGRCQRKSRGLFASQTSMRTQSSFSRILSSTLLLSRTICTALTLSLALLRLVRTRGL